MKSVPFFDYPRLFLDDKEELTNIILRRLPIFLKKKPK